MCLFSIGVASNSNLKKVAKFALAQDSTPYTDEETGIAFTTWSVPDITYGLALPADALEKDATEFIGLLVSFAPHYFQFRRGK